LYNGVKKAHEAQPSLGLSETLLSLEAKYSDILSEND